MKKCYLLLLQASLFTTSKIPDWGKSATTIPNQKGL